MPPERIRMRYTTGPPGKTGPRWAADGRHTPACQTPEGERTQEGIRGCRPGGRVPGRAAPGAPRVTDLLRAEGGRGATARGGAARELLRTGPVREPGTAGRGRRAAGRPAAPPVRSVPGARRAGWH